MSLRNLIRQTRLLIEHGRYETRKTNLVGHQRALELTHLEERVLFSASAVGPVVAEIAEVAGSLMAESALADDNTKFQISDGQLLDLVADSVLTAATTDKTVGTAPAEHTLELVFLDASVSNLDQLLNDLHAANAADRTRTLEIVVLQSQKDGIAQMTTALLQQNGVDGIHIVSQGDAGRIQLGSTTLSLDNLDTYRSAINAWKYALTDKADLMFYGCNLAESAEGQQLMNEMSQMTDTDVSASENLTGTPNSAATNGVSAIADENAGGANFYNLETTSPLESSSSASAAPSTNASLQFTTNTGHVLAFGQSSIIVAAMDHLLQVDMVGANSVPPLSENSNLATGAGTTGSQVFTNVTYAGLWDGVTATYDATDDAILKSTYYVDAGAAVGQIQLKYNRSVSLDQQGNLVIEFDNGTMTDSAPVAWQDIEGQRIFIDVSYALQGGNQVGFSVGAYDHNYQLVIDPTLTWNTFLGGSGTDDAQSIAVDGSGNIYVTGSSSSTWGSPIAAFGGGANDAYVAKLNSSGNVVWTTFLGGSGADLGHAITVDASGNIYVSGDSSATWGSPVRAISGGTDGFAAKLNSSGTLVWNTFLGGSGSDTSWGIGVDGSGNVYVSGDSTAAWGSPLRAYSSSDDVYAAKLNSSGSLIWSTFLGGSGSDVNNGIAVDSSGNVYVGGYSTASWGTPVRAYTSGQDFSIIKLDTTGSIIWNTFLGGSGTDAGLGIAIDGSGNVYVTGNSSATWGSPVQAFGGGTDAVAAKLNSSGNLVWNTFLGGSGTDNGRRIAVDGSGNVFVAGSSTATWGSPDQAYSSGTDGFAAELDSSGNRIWHTFVGGSGTDFANAIAVDGGNVYLAGNSTATWGSPVTSLTGGQDAFVVKFNRETTLSRRIAAASDDAEEEGPTGTTPNRMWLDSSDIELVSDFDSPTTGVQKVGLRFTGMDIPVGAIITDAYLVFRAVSPDSPMTNSDVTNLTLKGQLTGNASTFTTTSGNISSRTLTTAATAWAPSVWTSGQDYNSPDISSVIQEIVNQGTWASGNALAIIISGTGHRASQAYDSDPSRAAQLVVTYTTSAAVNTAPVNTVPTNRYTALNTAAVFSSGNGNALQISDSDAGSGTMEVTLSVSNGILTLGNTTGLTLNGGANGSATMTYRGTMSALNTALNNGLTFTPTNNFRGLAQLTMLTNDLGNTGTGGALTDSDTVNINVGSVVVTNTSDASNGTVTSIANLVANDGGDGISLREAIQAANATGGTDYIYFNIAGTGVHTINIASTLPTITGQLIIDASTDDSFAANSNRPAIILDGNNLAANGLTLTNTADGSTIRGLVIRDFAGHGIEVQAGSDGNTIAGNFIGQFTAAGLDAGAAEANTGSGVVLAGANNTLGGTTAADRNIISGNNSGVSIIGASATGNQVVGNYIGIDVTGNTAISNTTSGVSISAGATSNTIGGSVGGARNIISGNLTDGITISLATSSGNIVRGNYIGTNAAGTAAISNSGDGIWTEGAFTTIGGTAAGEGNLISANTFNGIYVFGAGDNALIQGNRIGTDVTGLAALGNGTQGVQLAASNAMVGGTALGSANTIAFNTQNGVVLPVGAGTGNAILGNAIYANGLIGIDLKNDAVTTNDVGDGDSGPNNLQNFPVLTSATTNGTQLNVTGSLNSTASSYYRIEFFSSAITDGSGYGEGQTYLGFINVTTNGSGNATISGPVTASVAAGAYISATATKSDATYAVFSDTSEFALNVVATSSNAAPTITLPGGALSYTENDAATIIDATATVTDADSANFDAGTLTIDYTANGTTNDRLAIRNQGTGGGQIGVSGANVTYGGVTIGTWTGGNGTTPLVITFNASSTPVAAQALMRNITYANVSDAPSVVARTVRFVLTDGDGGTSNPATKTINVTAVNDAPVLGYTGSIGITATDENTTSAATLVSDILFSASMTDVDPSSLRGIAITSVTANGTFQYSTDGTTWTNFGVVSNSNALLLTSTSQVRYVPDSNNGEVPTFTMRGWDQTSGTASANGSPGYFNSGAGGGSTAFSSQTCTVTLFVASVNDAPSLSTSVGFPGISEDNVTNTGMLVSTLAAPANDVDTGALKGIAVTSVDNTNGTWEYTLDGTTWLSIGSVSTASARLLPSDATTRIRFVPNANWNGATGITMYKAWDQTSGSAGALANVTTSGDTTAFSSGGVGSSLSVSAVNDVPVNAVPVSQTTGKNVTLVFSGANGNQISISDVDAGASLVRVTLTGSNGTVTLSGTTGLSFTVGTGAADATMTFTGTITNTNTALNGLSFAPTTGYTGAASLQVITNDQGNTGSGGALSDTDSVAISVTDASFWLSSKQNATSSGGSAGLSWTDGQVVNFGNPNLTLGAGTTGGTFSSVFNLDSFTADGDSNVNGLHYVSRTVVVGGGANTVTLQAGDVLLTVDADETLGGVAVTVNDIVLFRPTTPGNYSAGAFSILLQNPTGKANGDFALVEETTVVGGTTLQAGSFLTSQPSKKDLDLFVATGAGAGTTSGTLTTKFVDGAGVNISQGMAGIELIQGTVNIGGTTLTAGQLLLSLDTDDSTVGTNNIAIKKYDIFELNLTSTGSGTTSGTAAKFFDGLDVGISAGGEQFDAIALVQTSSAAPVVTVGGGSLAYTENDPATVINGATTVTDADSPAFSGGNLTVYFSANGTVNDRLAIRNQGTGGGQIGVSGTNVTYAGMVIGSFSGGDDGMTPLTVSLNSSATIAVTQALVRNITYQNVSDDPTTLPRSVTFVLSDGSGGTSNPVNKTINVTSVNDAPVLANGATVAYTENDAPTPINPAITVVDVDNTSLATGAVAITTNFASGEDVLSFTNVPATMGNITGTFSTLTGVMSLSSAGNSATLAEWQAALRAVQYSNSSDNPSTLARTVSYAVNDGLLDSNTVSATVNITAVNDAPVNSVPTSLTTDVNTPLVLSGINALVISDVDAAAGDLEISLAAVNGGLTLNGTTGLIFTTGTGTNNASMVFRGKLADINAALDGLTFNPTSGFNGSGSISLKTDDLGNTGSGGSEGAKDAISITIGNSTMSFQEGVGGYVGTEDTELQADNPATSFGNATSISIDLDSGSLESQGLIQFQNLFGSGVGQIPLGSVINSASLTLNVFGVADSSTTISLHRMLTAWTEASTWNSAVNGIQRNDVEAAAVADSAMMLAEYTGPQTFYGLKNALQTWADGGANHGWAIVSNSTDGWDFYSSEYATANKRPVLTVSYTAPQAAQIDLDANNSSGATGSDYATTFTEGGAAVNIADIDATLTDADDTQLQSMTVRITNLLNAGSEFLVATTSGTSITASYASGTGILTLSNADTLAHYLQVLNSITYENLSDAPDTTTRLITVVANDGFSLSNMATAAIAVVASNDAPTGVPVITGTAQEDQTLTADSTGIADPDGLGTFSYQWLRDGVAVVGATGGNYLLGDADVNTQISVEVRYTDAYGSSEGPLTSAQTALVANVNDEEVLVTYTALTVSEGDLNTIITRLMLETTDIDNTPSQIVYTLTSVPSTGSLRLNGTLLVNGNTFTQADINANLLTYDHNGAEVFTDSFAFTVDDGSGTSTIGSFAVTITPVNDNTPVITSNGGPANGVISIAENSTAVTTVMATDADLPTQTLTFSIVGGLDAGRFAIVSGSGVLTFAAAPNFESPADANADNVYEVIVAVSDGQGRASQQTITVTVTDVDEYDVTAPVDTNGAANQVAENAAHGTTVGITGFASDADATNNTVIYSLFNNDGGRFTIHATTGVVTVAGVINRETDGAIRSITIRATSADGSTNDTVFNIAIIDTNEFAVTAPVDVDAATNQVAENATIGTTVGITASASDADATNNTVTYALFNDDGGRFSIDATTGVVMVGGLTDREVDGPVRSITVRATSADGSTADTVFNITINDVNEFGVTAPVDTNSTTNQIAENAASGTVVGITAFASDADATTNGITYSLFNSDGGRFAIDATTGVVTVAGPINRETDGPLRSITVRATSADGSTNDTVLNIGIIDVNEFTVGVISDTNAAANAVAENAVNGTAVGITASASDADATNNTISYALFNDDGGRFQIDAITGVVTVAGPINREADGPVRSITVRATSTDGSITNQIFTITVTDVDEFNVTPIDDNDSAVDAVNENAAAGTSVGITAFASDADATTNAVTYSLDDNASGRFQIDSLTGIVTVGVTALDFESAANHSIIVRATSADGSSTTRAFSIAIRDLNDNAPVITVGQQFSVSELASAGTLVGNVAASDIDTVGSLQNWKIVGGNASGIFTIDAATGRLSIADATPLDFETTPTYTLTLSVSDGVSTSATQTVLISVLDDNEAPVMAPSQVLSINENSAAGTFVGNVVAADQDSGDTLTWSIVSASTASAFSIDPTSGGISVQNSATLNFETTPTITLMVRVTDAAGLSDTQAVIINVLDINDAPVAGLVSFVTKNTSTLQIVPAALLANAADEDGDALRVVIVSAPNHGTLAANSDGSWTYTVINNYSGSDTFSYYVTDGQLNSGPATISITVQQAIGVIGSGSGSSGNTGSSGSGSTDSSSTGSSTGSTSSTSTTSTTSTDEAAGYGFVLLTNGHRATQNSFGTDRAFSPTATLVDPGSDAAAAQLISGMLLPMAGSADESGSTAGRLRSMNSDIGRIARLDLWGNEILRGAPEDALMPLGLFQLSLPRHSEIIPQNTLTPDVIDKVVVGSTAVVSTSLSVGYVIWIFRGGSLLTAFMSTLPTWSSFDPLPVLQSFEKQNDDEDDTLLSIATRKAANVVRQVASK